MFRQLRLLGSFSIGWSHEVHSMESRAQVIRRDITDLFFFLLALLSEARRNELSNVDEILGGSGSRQKKLKKRPLARVELLQANDICFLRLNDDAARVDSDGVPLESWQLIQSFDALVGEAFPACVANLNMERH